MSEKLSHLESLRKNKNDSLTFFRHVEMNKEQIFECLVEALNRIEDLENRLENHIEYGWHQTQD